MSIPIAVQQQPRKNVPQMSKGSRRMMGSVSQPKPTLDSQIYYKSSPQIPDIYSNNIMSVSNKIITTTSDDDDEEYVLMYDSK